MPAEPVTTLGKAKAISLEIGERTDVYQQLLRDDSRRFDLSEPATLKQMSAVFPYRSNRDELSLSGGDTAEVLGLRLSLAITDVDSRTRQMELVIDNRSDKNLAYRISTRPSKGTVTCAKKEGLRHNAIVLQPGEIARRSECIYRSGWTLEVGKVEVIEVPPLSRFYLSAVPPTELGAEHRVAESHKGPSGGAQCQTVLPALTKRSFERGEILWRDLVDFFARHSCEKYRFPHDYRAFEKDSAVLLPAAGSVQ